MSKKNTPKLRARGKKQSLFIKLQNIFAFRLIFSLLAAVVIWLFINTNINPAREQRFTVAIQRKNYSALEAKGLILKNEVNVSNVTAFVKGREEDLSGLSASNFEATLDFDRIASTDDKRVRLDLRATDVSDMVTVLRYEPEEIEVDVEAIITKQLEIVPIWVGEPAEGYELTDFNISPRIQMLRGRASLVELAAKSELAIDLSELAGNRTAYYQSSIIDEAGEPTSVLDWEQNVEVSLEISKEVPVAPDIAGNAADDYYMLEYAVTPETVFINGTKEALEGVDGVFTELIDITSARGSISQEKQIVLPGNVKLSESKTPLAAARVDIAIERYGYRQIAVSRSNIQLIDANESGRYRYEIVQSEIPIILKGKNNALAAVTPDMVTAVVNVTGLNTGLHNAKMVVTLPDGVLSAQEAFLDVIVSTEIQGNSGVMSGMTLPAEESGEGGDASASDGQGAGNGGSAEAPDGQGGGGAGGGASGSGAGAGETGATGGQNAATGGQDGAGAGETDAAGGAATGGQDGAGEGGAGETGATGGQNAATGGQDGAADGASGAAEPP